MTISEYERLRQANIQRNEEFLRSLGVQNKEQTFDNNRKKSRKRDFSELQSLEERDNNRRRSRRIQNLPAESRNNDLYFEETADMGAIKKEKIRVEIQFVDSDDGRRKVTAPELCTFIQDSNPDHFDALSNEVCFDCLLTFLLTLCCTGYNSHRVSNELHVLSSSCYPS